MVLFEPDLVREHVFRTSALTAMFPTSLEESEHLSFVNKYNHIATMRV